MYADDLILLSETEKGLQNQIIQLNLFCKNWNLSINTKKTKVMTFNRGNRDNQNKNNEQQNTTRRCKIHEVSRVHYIC